LAVKFPNLQHAPAIPPQARGRQTPAATTAVPLAISSRPIFGSVDPTTSRLGYKPPSPPENDCFWDADSCSFDIGGWFDDKSASRKPQNVPRNSLQHHIPNSENYHEVSGYVGPLPSATPSPPIASRAKMSRENSSDYEPIHGSALQMNREKYRDHHSYQSDYSDPDHDGGYSDNQQNSCQQPNKIQRVGQQQHHHQQQHQLYHKPCHGESSHHDDGYHRDNENESTYEGGNNSDDVNGGTTNHTNGNVYYLDHRTISNCRISDSIPKVPIQHSLSCNSIPAPALRSNSFTSLHQLASHENNGHSSSTGSVNSFHIGGHSSHLHSSSSHQHPPRTILTSQEFKQQKQMSFGSQQQLQQQFQHQQYMQQQQQQQQFSPASVSSTTTHISTGSTLIGFHQPLQILRFTRISNHLWLLNVDKVYQIESFLQKHSSSVMYLLDDKMIPAEEWRNRKLESLDQDQTINGINDLQVELEIRKMFVTSWPPQLHDQLLGFVNNWNGLLHHYEEQKQQRFHLRQQQQNSSDERLSPSSPSSLQNESHLASDPPTLLSLWDSGPISLMTKSSNPSSGILAYEISLQHGLVIRCDTAGASDDNTMWSMIYLHDLLHPSPMPTTSPASWTCYDIFCRIFPQFSAFISHITQGTNDISSIGVKYCTHSMNSSTAASTSSPFSVSSSAMNQEGNCSPTPSCPRQDLQRAPPNPISSAYQTIGVLSDPSSKIIARFVCPSPPHCRILSLSLFLSVVRFQGEVPLFHDILIFPTR
jgi:hypothetical protein